MKACIAVDVGGTATKAAVVDRDGTIHARLERPTDPHAGTKGVISVAEELLSKAVELDVQITGIGVGAAGFIDFSSGSVTFSPNLVYDDPQVRDALQIRFNLPVVVDNDANAAAWGERTFGAARGIDHLVMITLGTGIGSGFIVDGKVLRGATGAGAEFGHTVIDPQGPPCTCGLRGCLEQFASGSAIARMAREAIEEDPTSSIVAFADSPETITAGDVARAARQLDETARTVLRRAGRALGIGLSNAVNIFDPEVLVLGGSVTAAGEPYLGPARDELAKMNAAQRRRPTRLMVSELGVDAGIIGAAALLFEST